MRVSLLVDPVRRPFRIDPAGGNGGLGEKSPHSPSSGEPVGVSHRVFDADRKHSRHGPLWPAISLKSHLRGTAKHPAAHADRLACAGRNPGPESGATHQRTFRFWPRTSALAYTYASVEMIRLLDAAAITARLVCADLNVSPRCERFRRDFETPAPLRLFRPS